MVLNHDNGSYLRGMPMRLLGSFLLTGTTTAPTVYRDGNSKCILSVARVSAGLFTVTFDAGFPLPERFVCPKVDYAGAAVPALPFTARLVNGSYSQTTRSFQIQVTVPTNATTITPAASDGAVGDVVSFHFDGSISSVGTDPA